VVQLAAPVVRLPPDTPACRRYDLDGVELDWLRYPDFFRKGEVNVATMTAFVREARGILDEAAKRRGHPLRLVSRVPVTPFLARQPRNLAGCLRVLAGEGIAPRPGLRQPAAAFPRPALLAASNATQPPLFFWSENVEGEKRVHSRQQGCHTSKRQQARRQPQSKDCVLA